MAAPSRGHRRNKQPSRYQQWRLNIWPYPMHHANYWLISHSSPPSPCKSLTRHYLRTTKRRSPSSSGNPIINDRNTSISDTTLYEIIMNVEASTSSTSLQINNSPTSSRSHSLASNHENIVHALRLD